MLKSFYRIYRLDKHTNTSGLETLRGKQNNTTIIIFVLLLYCIVLYCIVLCCIVLYCIVFYCILLYCIALHCIVLYFIELHCIALHCIVLYCIVLYCIVLHCIVLYCIALYCILLYKIHINRWFQWTCSFTRFSPAVINLLPFEWPLFVEKAGCEGSSLLLLCLILLTYGHWLVI